MRPIRSAIYLGLLTVFLSACGDDPSNVGIGLVDSQAGSTTVATVPAASFTGSGPGDVTGGDGTGGAARILFGSVTDPLLGLLSPSGFVDFVPSVDVDDDFRAGTVSYVDLEIAISYVLGDTTTSITIDVHEMDANWDARTRRADTSLVAGAYVTSVEFDPTATTLRIPLPASWIAAHATELTSTAFQDSFHGFRFSASQGNVVLGAGLTGSAMRASIAPGDTVDFPMSKMLTTVPPTTAANPPGNTIAILDSGYSTPSILFDFPSDIAIHQAIVRAELSDIEWPAVPGYERPEFTTIGLRAVSSSENVRLPLVTTLVGEDGEIRFEDPVIADVLQQSAFGLSTFDAFELYIPTSVSTLGYHLIKSGAPLDGGPRLIITYTPLD